MRTFAQSGEPATNIDWSTASDDQVLLQAIEETTPVPANEVPMSGEFYSAQHSPLSTSGWPPLPGNVNDLAAWNLGDNVWLLDDVTFDYTAAAIQASPTMAMDAGTPYPGSGGGYGTNTYSPSGSLFTLNPGTNLWIAQETATNGNFTGILSNTVADVEYQLLSENDLNSTQWVSDGFVLGSETTNCTPWDLPFSPTSNVFLTALSWQDDTGTGIPDWWWLKYFGQDTNVDSYADPIGDGWTLLQDFQNGWNPTNWNTPPAPQGLIIDSFNSASDTATLSWLPSSGPVAGYTIQTPGGNVNLSVGETGYVDNISSVGATYSVEADYAGGPSAWSGQVSVDGDPAPNATIVPGPGGNLYLVASGLPSDLNTIVIYRNSWNSGGPLGFVFNESGGYNDLINFPNDPLPNAVFQIPAADITNGVCEIPSSETTTFFPYQFEIQTIRSNGVSSGWALAGAPSPGYSQLYKIPFIDARRHLKDNLLFLLRGADDIGPFQIGTEAGSSLFNSSTNHVCADFYGSVATGQSIPDPLEPFDDNPRYENFVFDSNNMTNDNDTALPNTGIFYDEYGHIDFNYSGAYPSISYFFNAGAFVSETNLTVPTSVIGTNETTWLVPITIEGEENFYDNFPFTGDQNIYGLPFVSAEGALYQTNTLFTQTFYPGQGDLTGWPYYETEQPDLQITNYYFCEPGIDEMPEATDFASTNMTPLIIVPVGGLSQWNQGNTPTQLAAFARVSVNHANPDVYGYIGQYFTNAYQVDANGNVTTNTTGLLSPYGQFFATQPGPAALVTMPDVDTGQQGTGIVYCVSLQVDKNHDGVMDTSYNGADTTSPNSPMEFWINDSCDVLGANGGLDKDLEVPPAVTNYTVGRITCERDLENFARLWICGMPAISTGSNVQVILSMTSISGNPAINIYWSCETNGGIGYLTDTNIASQQLTDIGGVGYGASIATVSGGSLYTFPDDTFQFGGTQYLLFEGAGVGEGQLTLTILQNGNTVAQTSVYVDLHDIKDYYERAIIKDNTSGPISDWSSTVETLQQATSSVLGTDTNLIVMVHGINVGDWNWLDDSETVLKRLYWAGYDGKFMTVKWPCNFFNFMTLLNVDTTVFNDSELKAYKASGALNAYLTQLRSHYPSYQLNIYAHSQGNAVVSEAIAQGAPFDNYILTEGALPDSCYDVNAPLYDGLVAADNTYGPTPEWQPMGYAGIYTNFVGRIFNFYNTNDPVLAVWQSDQGAAKPNTPATDYTYFGSTGYYDEGLPSGYTVTDPEESRAEISRSRTLAIGQSPPTSGHGVIKSAIDLTADFGFGNAFPEDHSAQWTRPIQTTLPYYQEILAKIAPAP
jgi:hypothetical protein